MFVHRDLWAKLYNNEMPPMPAVSTTAASVRCLESLEDVASGAWGGQKVTTEHPAEVRSCGKAGRYVSINGYGIAQVCLAQFCLF